MADDITLLDTPQPRADATQLRPLYFVLGASGYIGSHLVPRLVDTDARVRAASRNPRVLAARQWAGVEIARADALDPGSLDAALSGVDVAYYLVHSMAAGKNFGKLDLQAAANFAAAAERAGVKRIIYLGGLIPEDASSEHIVSRRETGEVLMRGSVPVVELRAGIIVGPGSAAFEVMRDLVFHLPIMLTPKWVRSRSPPIALEDLLTYLVALASLPDVDGRVFDAAGPDNLTYEEMMRILAEEGGKRPPRVISVPFLTPKFSSYWVHLVTSVPTPIARALIEGLRHDFYADDAELRRHVPQHLLGFREAVAAAFAAERDHTVVSRWVEGAFAVRNERIDYAYYAKKASGSATTWASPSAVWQIVTRIGGDNRYFYLNSLWTIREILDFIVGGPGLKHQRRDPQDLRVGDQVDSWKVVGLEPERRLSLAFGMRAPGAGMLEFEIEHDPSRPEAEQTRLTVTAYWHPAGVWGLMYWYSLEPFHVILFRGMTDRIVEQAEALERETSHAHQKT